jgi:glutathione-dependent peroxiredoxin
MHTRKEGDPIPRTTFRIRTEDGWEQLTTEDLFKGRNVVVFSLPGAFTPTCSGTQLPGYNRLAPLFAEHGIDDILCISVNDAFVMREWQRSQNADRITMIPDGNAEFTEAMGMLVDKRDLGFGLRSWRYAMIVRDGIIDQLFVEPQQPGDPYEVSDPATVLRHIAPDARVPESIALLVRSGCSHCVRAKTLLDFHGLPYDAIEITGTEMLYALSGARTTPQVFIDGKLVGGADEVEAWLKAQSPDRATAARAA